MTEVTSPKINSYKLQPKPFMQVPLALPGVESTSKETWLLRILLPDLLDGKASTCKSIQPVLVQQESKWSTLTQLEVVAGNQSKLLPQLLITTPLVNISTLTTNMDQSVARTYTKSRTKPLSNVKKFAITTHYAWLSNMEWLTEELKAITKLEIANHKV